MKPQVVTYHLNKFLDDDAIIAADMRHGHDLGGALHRDARATCCSRPPGCWRRWATACPTRSARRSPTPAGRSSCLCGDGGFTMLMGEMATLVKYKLPVKVIIIKNNALGQIKWEQMVFEGNPQFGVRAAADRLRRLRRGLRVPPASRSTIPTQAEEVLREALRPPGPGAGRRRWSIPTSRRCPGTRRWSRPGTSPSR